MDQPRFIQRLWYTAPPGEGFRNCAVTDDLRPDIYKSGPLIRALERYARYDPPDGIARDDASNFVEEPDLELAQATDAPISLSLIDIRNPDVLNNQDLAMKLRGRVLVNGLYLGKIGANSREGNIFIDLLANLPEGFSACEALALWRATSFWQQRYDSPHEGAIKPLPPVELPPALVRAARHHLVHSSTDQAQEPLRNPFARVLLAPETARQLTELLTFLIHAYLLQQQREWPANYARERKRQRAWQEKEILKKTRPDARKTADKEREYKQLLEQQHQELMRFKRIFVAAEDDRLACCLTLLARLFQDIPALLIPLTFSTYEYDVLASECLIIGTSPSRAGEHDSRRLEKLLPLECEQRGFIYHAYTPVRNSLLPSHLPVSEQQPPQEPLRVEAVARYLARKLMQPGEPGEILTRHLTEVAERISAAGEAIPAQLFVQFWQQKLVITELLKKPYLSRAEVGQLLQDPERGEFLAEEEVSRQVSQWIIADCKGLDLEQPAASRKHSAGVWQAQRPPDTHTLPEQTAQWVRRQMSTLGGAALATSLAANLCSLLEEYADNRPQPASYGQEEDYARRSFVAGERSCFDVIVAYKRERDPEAFRVLLNVLSSCEQMGAPAGDRLLRYLFSTRQASGQRVFLHKEAGAFVLRHFFDAKLADQGVEQHWHLHRDLLNLANQALPETLPEDQLEHSSTPLDLVTPLLQFPLGRYLFLCGDEATRKRWHRSWRQQALMYQIHKLHGDGSLSWFNGHHWEELRVSAGNTQDCRNLIRTHWQTHALLVSEAIDCLDEWENALPLFDEQSPPLPAEMLQQFESPQQITRLQHVIWQQTETGQPQNIKTVTLFYQKLIEGGYSPANTQLLLETWHNSWMQERISTQNLRAICERTTNLSQDTLQHILLNNKEVYKRRKAEELLVSLYSRYQQAGAQLRQEPAALHSDAAQRLLFQVLDGAPVSQSTLDALLSLANPDHIGKVEFFVRLGRIYLPEYFKKSTPQRSQALLGLFLKLIAEDQALQSQTLKPGQPFPLEWRKVILAIFWLWLSAAGDDEIVDWLFERVNPQPGEIFSLLVAFGSTYMTARRAGLKALCQNAFQKLCAAASLTPAGKLLLSLNLLPPGSFPCMPAALTIEETLAIFQTAALTLEATPSYLQQPSLFTDLRLLLAQQEAQPGIQAEVLVSFLQEQGRKADELLSPLQHFLEQATRSVGALAKDVEAFRDTQAYRQDYAASEMELFLELQEYRVKGNYPPELAPPPPAVYLRYQAITKEAELAVPFKRAYLSYLQTFSAENFTKRQESLRLLTTLSGTGALEKSIDDLSNGLLVVGEFLQISQRMSGLRTEIPNNNGEEDETALSSTEIRKLEQAVQRIQLAGLRPERHRQLVDQLICAIVACVSDQSDVSRVCKLGPVLCEPQKKNPEFALLLQLSQQASKYYRVPARQQQQPEWFAPYLETLPLLHREFSITRETTARRNEIMQALLFVNNEPEKQTLLALDAYLQRAAAGRLLRKVVALWDAYKSEDLRIGLALSAPGQAPAAQEKEAEQPTLPIEAVQSAEERPLIAPVSRAQDLADRRISWFEGFKTVHRMRKAINNADRPAMQELWGTPKTYDILHLYHQQIGRTRWARFQALRQLDEAYRDLLATNPDSLELLGQREEYFLACVQLLDLAKSKRTWRRASLSPEQERKYTEIRQRRKMQNPGARGEHPASL
jgi:predicted transcriptional regulator